MNARSQEFRLSVEGCQVEEAVSSIFHTILVHRTLGKFHYKAEGTYSIGTVGTEDVDCDFIDLTYIREAGKNYSQREKELALFVKSAANTMIGQLLTTVRVNSEGLCEIVARDIVSFRDTIRQQESQRYGQISLELYQKHKRSWLGDEDTPWEIWTLCLNLVKVQSEAEHQRLREIVGEELSDAILDICSAVNRQEYVPKMPVHSELNLVFDTRFPDVQPYLFKIKHKAVGPGSKALSVTSTVKKLIKDTLYL